MYVGWFLTLQNARLLFPAAALLAPAAAERLVDHRQEKDTYRFYLDRDIIKPGLYYIRLTADKNWVRKLIIQ